MLLQGRDEKSNAIKRVYVFTLTYSSLHNLTNMPVHKCMFQVPYVDFSLIFWQVSLEPFKCSKSTDDNKINKPTGEKAAIQVV